ncbi:MAG: type IV secretory system conjugative DNA transfer family protein [Pirellulales bacterium]
MLRIITSLLLWLEAALHRAAWTSLLISGLMLGGLLAFRFPLAGILLTAGAAARCWTRRGPSGAHGTADWAGYNDLARAGCLERAGALQLGCAAGVQASPRQIIRAILLEPPWRTRAAIALAGRIGGKATAPLVYLPASLPHTAVFGASGSGKTTCFVVDNLRQDPSPAFILDPKGELLRLSGEIRARKFGHELAVLDPFGLARGKFPASGFNPLALYRGQPDTLVDEARRLANAVIVRTGHEHERFWGDAAQSVIEAAIAFLMSCARPEEATLWRVREILSNAKLTEQMLAHMEQSNACHGLLRRLAGQVRRYQGNTGNNIFSYALTSLAFMDSVPVAKTLQASTFDVRKFLDGHLSIYCLLPVDRLREMAGLQRIIVTALINYVFQAGESRSRRIRFYLDEAASLGGDIEALYSATCFGRSYGLRLFLLFQAVSQVQRCFPEAKAADFRGTVASIFAGTNDLQTAEEVSKYIGSTTVYSQSHQTSTNWGGSKSASPRDVSDGTSWGGSGSTTQSETARPLIHPDEVLRLPPGAAIALLPGVRPILLEKLPYYRRPSWFREARSRLLGGLIALILAPAAPALAFGAYLLLVGDGDPLVRAVAELVQRLLAST